MPSCTGPRAFANLDGTKPRSPGSITRVRTFSATPRQAPKITMMGKLESDISTTNPSQAERWNASTLGFKSIGRLEPYLLQPLCNAPGLGSRVHTGARCGSNGTLVIAISDSESPNTVSFAFGSYNNGSAPIMRYRFINGAFLEADALAANATNDIFAAGPGDTDLWVFAAANAASGQPVLSARLAHIPNATKISIRYNYVQGNLDLPSSTVVSCGVTPCVVPTDPAIGKVYYRIQYLNSNNAVLATSDVQTM